MQEWMGRVRREVGRVGFHCETIRIVGTGDVNKQGTAYHSNSTIPGARAKCILGH